MLGRHSGSLEAWKGELPQKLRGLELRKNPATLGQACFWWQMGYADCKWITKPNHQENNLLYGDTSHSTFFMHVVPLTSFHELVYQLTDLVSKLL